MGWWQVSLVIRGRDGSDLGLIKTKVRETVCEGGRGRLESEGVFEAW